VPIQSRFIHRIFYSPSIGGVGGKLFLPKLNFCIFILNPLKSRCYENGADAFLLPESPDFRVVGGSLYYWILPFADFTLFQLAATEQGQFRITMNCFESPFSAINLIPILIGFPFFGKYTSM
jgi:hypothetical protein